MAPRDWSQHAHTCLHYQNRTVTHLSVVRNRIPQGDCCLWLIASLLLAMTHRAVGCKQGAPQGDCCLWLIASLLDKQGAPQGDCCLWLIASLLDKQGAPQGDCCLWLIASLLDKQGVFAPALKAGLFHASRHNQGCELALNHFLTVFGQI